MFSCEFCETFKSSFFKEHLWTKRDKICSKKLQNLQENNCAVASLLIKLQAVPFNFIKKRVTFRATLLKSTGEHLLLTRT